MPKNIKGQKALNKFFSSLTIFSLVLQSLSGIFFLTPAYSQEITPTPAPEVINTPTPEPTAIVVEPTVIPTIQPTDIPVPTDAPTITPTPVEEVLPIPTDTITPVPTVEVLPIDTVTPTPETLANPPPQEQNNSNNDSNSQVSGDSAIQSIPTVIPTIVPTITTEVKETGRLSAMVLTDTAAASIDQFDLEVNSEGSATLKTDKLDYAPTDTVLITGAGFLPNKTYTLVISSTDEPPVTFETSITTDDKGNLFYSYQLDGNYRPNYKVEIKDVAGLVVASVTFTDAVVSGSISMFGFTISNSSSYSIVSGQPTAVGEFKNGSIDSYPEGACIPVEIKVKNTSGSAGDIIVSPIYDYLHSVTGISNLEKITTGLPNDPKSSVDNLNDFVFTGSPLTSTTSFNSDAGSISAVVTGPFSGDTAGTNVVSETDSFRHYNVTLSNVPDNKTVYMIFCAKLGLDAHQYTGSSLSVRSVQGGAENIPISVNKILELPSITLTKVVSGGSATPNQWTFNTSPSINGQSAYSIPVGGTVTINNVSPDGNYIITESGGPTGYSLTNVSGTNCAYTAANNSGTASVAAGNPPTNTSCTFSNTLQNGTVIVHKDVQGPNGEAITDTSQNFTVKLDNANPQNLTDNGSYPYTNVSAGAHTVTEDTLPTGYTLYGITPDNDGGTAGAQITVTAGQTTNVYVTNRQQQTKLTLTKTVVNNNGGTKQVADFVLKIDGDQVTSGVTNNVTPGFHTVSEVGLPGYTASSWGGNCNTDGTITLALGDNKTCSITNDDQAATLIVKKIVTNDNGGTLDLEDFSFSVNGDSAVSFETDGQNDLTIDAGTYTVTEPAVTGYSPTDDNCTGLVIANGGSATCTITNNDDAPSLTLLKSVTNNNGGNSGADAWTLTATGPTSFSGFGPSVSNGISFDAGTYTLTESGPDGYIQSNWVCAGSGNQTGSNIIVLGLGQSATCTITNDDIAPSLTLLKHVNKDNGGTATADAWTLTATGLTGFSGAGPSVSSDASFDAGTYILSESGGPSGYTASVWSCVKNSGAPVTGSSITLGLNDTAICTITNDDNQPGLHLRKTITNDNGGTAVDTDWTLTATGTGQDPTNLTGTTPVDSGTDFKADTYILSETGGPTGYTAGSWSCTGGTQNGNTITVALGESATCTINNNDKVPSLTLNKVVINDNSGTAAESHWTLTADGGDAGMLSGPGAEGDTDVVSGTSFKAGTYALSESAGPAGYTASSWSCIKNGTPVSLTNPSIALDLGDTATCTIINNDQTGHLIVHKTTVPAEDQTVFSITLSANPVSGNITRDLSTVADVNYEVNAGTYSVSEAVKAGWDETGNTCINVIVGNGETKNCTITNTKRGQIIVEKNAIPDNTQIFTFQNDFANSNPTTFNLTDDSTPGFASRTFEVIPGTYIVSEDATPGWQSPETAICDQGETIDNIDVTAGETVTCTFTNEKLSKITLVKNTVGDNGTFDFTMTGQGLPATAQILTSANSGSQTFVDLDPDNTYTIAETVPAGWDLNSATCDSGDLVSNITPNAGEEIICTFTNTKKGSVSGQKYNDLNGDGDKEGGESGLPGWTIKLMNETGNGELGSTGTDTQGNYTFTNILPGNYQVCEINQPDWTNTDPGGSIVSPVCESMTIVAGQNTVVDFGNFELGKISGYKFDDRDGNGSWDNGESALSDWTINLNGSVNLSTTTNGSGYYEFTGLTVGDYTLSEVVDNTWTQTLYPNSPLNIQSGSVYADQDFGNFKNVDITVCKYVDANGDGDISNDSLYLEEGGWEVTLGDDESEYTNNGCFTYSNLGPGNYDLSEGSLPGWTQTYPESGYYNFDTVSGQNETYNFGNYQYGQIQACKYDDLDGDGQIGDEPTIFGVTMNLYKWEQSESFRQFDGLGSWVLQNSQDTEENGCTLFSNLLYGDYRIGENVPTGYYQTVPLNPDYYSISVQSGTDLTRDFLNAQFGSIGDTVYEDDNNNQVQDGGELGISGVTVNLYFDQNGDGIVQPNAEDGGPVATETTNGSGVYLFQNLIAGAYLVDVDETTLPVGYSLTTANDPAPVALTPGQVYNLADFGYKPIPPSIELNKTNDKSGGASAGDTVTYTLKLTNGAVPLTNIEVKDSLPFGFSYIAGSTTGASEPIISGDTLKWAIDSLKSGEVLTITYQAKIDSSQQAGNYYNFATCKATANREQGINCNVDDSSVNIGQSFSFSTAISGSVLGVSTGEVLGAATGSQTYWLIMAIIMMVGGLFLINRKRFIK